MPGSEAKQLEIDEQIDELARKSFGLFSADLKFFLADKTAADRAVSAEDFWDEKLEEEQKQALIKIYVDHKTDPKTGVDRDSWRLIQGLGLNQPEEKKEAKEEPKKVLSMKPSWLSTIQDARWTDFSADFCARGGEGGFTVCDFKDRDQPKNFFVDVAVSGERLHVPCLLALPQGHFAAVGKGKEKVYVMIFNMKEAAEEKRLVAQAPLPDTTEDFSLGHIRMVADPKKPEKFMVTRTNEMLETATMLCCFDEQTKTFTFKRFYLQHEYSFFSNLNLFARNESIERLWLEEHLRPSYSNYINDITFVGKNYVILYCWLRSLFIIATVLSDDKYEFASLRKDYLEAGAGTQFYPLTQNGFLIVQDSNSHRSLTYFEIQGKELKKVVVAELPKLAVMQIASSGEVFYVSKREVIGDITNTTVSVFDPYIKTSYPVFEFKDRDIQDLVLRPGFKLGVCYTRKDEARCDFYPLPQLVLRQKRIAALSDFPASVAQLILDYADLPDARVSKPPLRDLSQPSKELSALLGRMEGLEIILRSWVGRNRLAWEINDVLKELRELLTTRADLDYSVIEKQIRGNHGQFFGTQYLPYLFFSTYNEQELRRIVSDLKHLPRPAEEKIDNIPPPTIVKDEEINFDQIKVCSERLQNLLASAHVSSRFYSSPERRWEKKVAIDALLLLIQNGRCPIQEELKQFKRQHLTALGWGSLSEIFAQLKEIAPVEPMSKKRGF